jgi:hypothetical protein
MSDNAEAAARRRYCAAALRALDAFEAFVDPRVLSDFQDTRSHPHNRRKEPMGLLRLREKLNALAYDNHMVTGASGIDRDCLFSRFDSGTGRSAFVPSGAITVRQHMAGALEQLLSIQIRLEWLERTADTEAELAYWKAKVKELEDEYIADQEERAAAVTRAGSSSSASVATSASASTASLAKQSAAVTSPAAAAAAASSTSKPMTASTPPRGATAQQAERKMSAAHLPSPSGVAPSTTSSSRTAAAAATHVSQPPVGPAAASVGASAAAAAASSSVVPTAKPANLAAAMRGSFAEFVEHAEQLERDKGQLQRQLDERTGELNLLTAKAAASKRKAQTELQSEAKRRLDAEGKLAALSVLERKDKCVRCVAKQPDVLFLRCRHLVCCNDCAETIVNRPAAGAVCPQCQAPLVADDRIKVNRV